MAFPAVPRNAKSYDIENAINRILRWLNPGFGADNAGKVLTSNSTGTDLEWAAVPHNLLQMVSFSTGALATGTTQIPADDTIPQNTEGDQYMSLSITPKSATSKLIVEVIWNGSHTAAAAVALAVALFKDSDADALKVAWGTVASAGNVVTIPLRAVVDSPGTSEVTFKVRAGGQISGTTTFNGSGGSRFYGGVMGSGIVIREYAGS